jgi:hypothetical protein
VQLSATLHMIPLQLHLKYQQSAGSRGIRL